MLRPEVRVLPDDALVPEPAVVSPPPNRFTHELIGDESYPPEGGRQKGGALPAGTPVVLMVEGEERCRVVDGRGRYVEVRRSNLRRLPGSSSGGEGRAR
jgi:hypothetical protein